MKKVTCINAEGRKNLTEGKMYDVVRLQEDGDYIVIDDSNTERKVYANRFEDAIPVPKSTIIKTVVCIDDSGRKYLTEGDEYTVIALQEDGDYVVIDDSGKERKVYASRFEDIDTQIDFDDDTDNSFDDDYEDYSDDDDDGDEFENVNTCDNCDCKTVSELPSLENVEFTDRTTFTINVKPLANGSVDIKFNFKA